MGPHRAVAVLAAFAWLAVSAPAAGAAASPSSAVADASATSAPTDPASPAALVTSLLVKYAPGVDAPTAAEAVPGADALRTGVAAGTPVALGWSTVTLATPVDEATATAMAATLAGTAEVAAAEPDRLMHAVEDLPATTSSSTTTSVEATVPVPYATAAAFTHVNDTYYGYQWGFASYGDETFVDHFGNPLGTQTTGTNLTEALAVPRVASPVVAVIDTGITAHPDLAGVMLRGYDFVSEPAIANDGDGRDADATDPGDGIGADEAAQAPYAQWACTPVSRAGTAPTWPARSRR